MKNLILFSAIGVFFASSCGINKNKPLIFNDIIYMRSGEEVPAKIVKIKDSVVYFTTPSGKHQLPSDSISSIDIGKIRRGDTWKNINEISDTVLQNAIHYDVSRYAGHNYVNLLIEKDITMQKDSSYTLTVRIIRKILTEVGSRAGNIAFDYPDFADANIVFARSISKKGHIVHIRDNAIEDANLLDEYPYYSHIKQKKFAVPESKPGNIIDVEYKIYYPPTSLHNPFYFSINFGTAEPTVLAMVHLFIPSTFSINFYQERLEKPRISNKGNKLAYTWEAKDLYGIYSEPYSPPASYILPFLTFGSKQTWRSIANYITSNLASLQMPAKQQFQTPFALYNDIQKNIEYVPCPPSYSHYRFRKLSGIITDGYANLLDKSSLLYAILKSKGYKVKFYLVKTKNEPITTIVPQLGLFDGACVLLNDSVYLFPASRYTPYGYIPPAYQGGIYLDTQTGEIGRIPLLIPEDEKTVVKRDCLIQGDDILVTETRIYKGYNNARIRNLGRFKDDEIRKRIEKKLAMVWGNASLLNLSYTPFDSLSQTFTLELQYKVGQYIHHSGKLIMFKLPGIFRKSAMMSLFRHYPLFLQNAISYTYKNSLVIPGNFKIVSMGRPNLIRTNEAMYKISYLSSKKRIIKEESFIRVNDIIEQNEYKKYLNVIESGVKNSENWIILKSK